MKNRLDALYTIFRVTKSSEVQKIYNALRKEYRRIIVEVRKAEVTSELRGSENKMRAVWKIIKEETHGNIDVGRVPDSGINITAGDFNEYFGTVGSKLSETTQGPVQDADAFREALRLFDNIGILVNCAGFLNEFYWQKEMQVNLVCKCLKGYNPQKKFKTDRFADTAYVINIASITGLVPILILPQYGATKHAVVGLTSTLGLNEVITNQGIRIVGLCTGGTTTAMSSSDPSRTIVYKELMEEISEIPYQKSEVVGKSVIDLLQKSESGSIWVINDSVLSKVELPVWGNLAKLYTDSNRIE
ncbi:short chain dehydrogenase [Popillia japonica]|uniref:15-hydroxyprostaglandin dehydrogenase [NAD(+)] n=1 Tax=Popillia japonica TaxID=7064 RepID=A0AAW1IZN7_POPJA